MQAIKTTRKLTDLTILSVADVIDHRTVTIESTLDALDSFVTGTINSKLDLIESTDLTILSVVDVVESIDRTIASVVEVIDPRTITIESTLDVLDLFVTGTVNSKLDMILATSECGIAITQQDIGTTGYTIAASGKYCLVENILYAASGSTPAITIAASNVVLDLNGRSLAQSNATAGVIGISIAGGSTNVFIMNGVISSMTSSGIASTGSLSNVAIENLYVYNSGVHGIGLTGSSNDLQIINCYVEGNSGDGIECTSATRAFIDNCASVNNTGHGILIAAGSYLVISNCSTMSNTSNGITLQLTTTSKVIECISIGNGADGIAISGGQDCEVIDCNVVANIANGIHLSGTVPTTTDCYIHNNTLIKNSGINLAEDNNNGPNSILGNFAQNASLATNYAQGLSGITTATIQQSQAFTSSPTSWYNINMIP